jgi:glycerol-1-phosphate dehydrogenase [NAD(P)+]
MVGSRWMELPRIVAVGSEVLLELPDICRQLQLQGRALIITGPRTHDVTGKTIFRLLEERGYQPETIICSASKLEEVDRAERLAREMGADFLIGAGGGRSIDIAKLASLGLCVPFLSVPTAASHDGICSSQASLTVNGETTSIKAHSPLAIVADSNVPPAARSTSSLMP